MALVTVYDLLEVDENESKENIEKAYLRLVNEYKIEPNQSEEIRNQNKLILKKLRIAYDILSDDEKRDKYNKELAKKRAEELIKKVTVKKSEIEREIPTKEDIKEYNQKTNYSKNMNKEQELLTEKEKKILKKAAEKEFKGNLKKVREIEEEYNRAYNEAYNNYLKKMGYSIKEPWTMKRIKKLMITILIIIAFGILVFCLPQTQKLLIQIYEENFIVKSLIDIVVIIFNAIVNALK